MALSYGGTYPPIHGILPFTLSQGTTTFNVDSASFDERGIRFTAPFACRLRGVYFNLSHAAGADFEVINYNGTTAVSGMTRTYLSAQLSSTSNRILAVIWDTSEELAAGAVRRITLRPTTTNTVTINTGRVGVAAAMNAWCGDALTGTERLNQGAWSDLTTDMFYMFPIFDRLDDGVTSIPTGSYEIAGAVTLSSSPVSGATVRVVDRVRGLVSATTTNGSGEWSVSVDVNTADQFAAVVEYEDGGQKYNAPAPWAITAVTP
jgi:hypothetical protein